jgi:hypothetical protein
MRLFSLVRKKLVLILAKNGLGYVHFGHFFINSSGHPANGITSVHGGMNWVFERSDTRRPDWATRPVWFGICFEK